MNYTQDIEVLKAYVAYKKVAGKFNPPTNNAQKSAITVKRKALASVLSLKYQLDTMKIDRWVEALDADAELELLETENKAEPQGPKRDMSSGRPYGTNVPDLYRYYTELVVVDGKYWSATFLAVIGDKALMEVMLKTTTKLYIVDLGKLQDLIDLENVDLSELEVSYRDVPAKWRKKMSEMGTVWEGLRANGNKVNKPTRVWERHALFPDIINGENYVDVFTGYCGPDVKSMRYGTIYVQALSRSGDIKRVAFQPQRSPKITTLEDPMVNELNRVS